MGVSRLRDTTRPASEVAAAPAFAGSPHPELVGHDGQRDPAHGRGRRVTELELDAVHVAGVRQQHLRIWAGGSDGQDGGRRTGQSSPDGPPQAPANL